MPGATRSVTSVFTLIRGFDGAHAQVASVSIPNITVDAAPDGSPRVRAHEADQFAVAWDDDDALERSAATSNDSHGTAGRV